MIEIEYLDSISLTDRYYDIKSCIQRKDANKLNVP